MENNPATQSVPKTGFHLKFWHILIIVLLGIVVISPPWFIVQPSEMAGLRRLGKVINTKPIQPGFYLKIPWLDMHDTLQVSLTPFQISDLPIFTLDNQWINISVGISFTVPEKSVFKLLYEVGRSGGFDIEQNIRPVISESTMMVFSKYPAEKLTIEREQVVQDLEARLSSDLQRIFGINITDVQIIRIEYLSERAAMLCEQIKQLNNGQGQTEPLPLAQ